MRRSRASDDTELGRPDALIEHLPGAGLDVGLRRRLTARGRPRRGLDASGGAAGAAEADQRGAVVVVGVVAGGSCEPLAGDAGRAGGGVAAPVGPAAGRAVAGLSEGGAAVQGPRPSWERKGMDSEFTQGKPEVWAEQRRKRGVFGGLEAARQPPNP